MNFHPYCKLICCLAVAFGLPWLFLVVVPFVAMSNAEPVPYTEAEAEEIGGGVTHYPDPALYRYGASDYGRRVFAAEGCAYCHTQVVRPTYAGPDMWREGWGGRAGQARETWPLDYSLEGVALLGYQRIGQDLANVGGRVVARGEDREGFDPRAEMHRHLYDPKSFDPDSGMPAFRHLYRDSPTGEGVVPTARAEALVDYLLSLRKDQPLPEALLDRN